MKQRSFTLRKQKAAQLLRPHRCAPAAPPAWRVFPVRAVLTRPGSQQSSGNPEISFPACRISAQAMMHAFTNAARRQASIPLAVRQGRHLSNPAADFFYIAYSGQRMTSTAAHGLQILHGT